MKTNVPVYQFIISLSFLPRMRNVSDKICRKNQNTYFVFSNFVFFFSKTIPCLRKCGKNAAERGRPQITIWRMRITTNAHRGCAIISVFPSQQRLHERASMLRYTYITCLVSSFSNVTSMFALNSVSLSFMM
jgi:hypothetical protein